MCRRCAFVLLLLIGLSAAPAYASAPQVPLVVLRPTGETRDGLPVVERHPGGARAAEVLSRGFSGRLLRLYAMEQAFLSRRTGLAPEPAYLVLSDRQGGFPKFGFHLDGQKKPQAGWVDLHRSSRLTGRFGAVDQIFPHELLHVIVHQLAGEPRESGGNQVHAVGVRTDPVTAFGEGFAETAQILAVDDPDAWPETRALAGDTAAFESALAATHRYRRELARPYWPIRASQWRFLLWFSQTEQVLRYGAVKANRFAREAAVPASLLTADDGYRAYLVRSVVPGDAGAPAKPPGVLLSTEGVVAHVMWRILTHPAMQGRFQDDAFYAEFGTRASELSGLDNACLKVFATFANARPSTLADWLRAYVRLFPSDAADVEAVVREALIGGALPDAAELWFANARLQTGTSLFDQFRALPRPHTFDANAATVADWIAVEGVTPDVAVRLVAHAPYTGLDAIMAVPGVPPALRGRLEAMAREMDTLRSQADGGAATLSLWAIVRAYLWRLGALVAVTGLAGAWLARRAGIQRRWTAALAGLAAAIAVVGVAWILTAPPWYAPAAPVVVCGLPWAAWRLLKRRGAAPTFQALAAWAAAALPAALITWPW